MQGPVGRLCEVRKRGSAEENPEADPERREDRPGRSGRNPGSHTGSPGEFETARELDILR